MQPSWFTELADAFRYPALGRLETLQRGCAALPSGDEKKALDEFLGKIGLLSLGQWEELYTRTLDLNPPAAPYVGFQTWGESYPRGTFLSHMSRELAETGVDLDGELPDHLVPVLRYLGQAAVPLPELMGILVPAIQRMQSALRKADPDNPYLDLFEAALNACKDMKKEAE